jgi:thiol:disulfide interchange protein DsbA
MLDPGEIADFMANNGIDKAKWNETFNSFSVNTRVSRAGQIWRAYKIDGTPAMAVGGRFITAPSMVGSREGTLPVLDFLIARVRSDKRK